MKRVTALLLTLVMLLAVTCTAASAETAVTVTVGAVKGEIGDIVEVPVSLSEGHYAVNGRIFLTFDPTVLELQEVCDDADNPYFETINPAIIDSSFMWMVRSPEAGRLNFVFSTASSMGNAAGGAMFTLTFKLLKEGVGEIAVTVPELRTNSTGGDDADAELTVVNGAVKVTPVDPTPPVKGDVNGDGLVRLPDAVRLFYFVNRMAELTDKQIANADVTGDGKVNLMDAARVFYNVSGMIEL